MTTTVLPERLVLNSTAWRAMEARQQFGAESPEYRRARVLVDAARQAYFAALDARAVVAQIAAEARR